MALYFQEIVGGIGGININKEQIYSLVHTEMGVVVNYFGYFSIPMQQLIHVLSCLVLGNWKCNCYRDLFRILPKTFVGILQWGWSLVMWETAIDFNQFTRKRFPY